ncbi:hypothetical protein OG225_26055 [Nocardia sp. NBC_01377]|uniref:hypothetical protein n=1 Tax=Nocardia sp. NBC_01377 TaxID=2903595 RepID=UPI00324B8F16
MAIVVLAAGCAWSGDSTTDGGQSRPAVSGDFGTLSGVCHPGEASTAPAQGVSPTEIEVGMFSDIGFTKNTDYVDAARVSTSWCNAAGGINGRTG